MRVSNIEQIDFPFPFVVYFNERLTVQKLNYILMISEAISKWPPI
jgi:hypothetical protein